jgi:hypothetical protein
MFFSMEFEILFGPGALPFPKFLKHMSYVLLSNVLAIESSGFPLFSSTNPSKSCQGYCLTPHVHVSW